MLATVLQLGADVQFLLAFTDALTTSLMTSLDLFACPSCPPNVAAREAFFGDDVGTRFAGMLGPFVVMVGVVKLVLTKLERRDKEARRDRR